MGRRGPKPTPSEILRARGSWRGDINKSEPAPVKEFPECPEWLSEDAKAVWREIAGVIAAGVASTDNANSLARYCDAFVRWKKAAAFIAEKGEIYTLKDSKGEVRCVMPWPQVSIYMSLGVMLARLEQEFGLTPASRTRIHLAVSESAARAPHQQRPTPARSDGEPVLRIAE